MVSGDGTRHGVLDSQRPDVRLMLRDNLAVSSDGGLASRKLADEEAIAEDRITGDRGFYPISTDG